MYRIKYEKNRLGAILRTLIFVLFFAAGGITSLIAERFVYAKDSDTDLNFHGEVAETKNEEKEEPMDIPPSDIREVWIRGIEIGNYIYEGDVIDVRWVDSEGRDEKLLASKTVTGLDREGIFLLVREEELPRITETVLKKEEGTVVRIYAVRIP